MYTPRQVPNLDDKLAARQWFQQEFQTISQQMNGPQQAVSFVPLQTPPAKVYDGIHVLAVGAWNPGSGPGEYRYLNGAWKFLG